MGALRRTFPVFVGATLKRSVIRDGARIFSLGLLLVGCDRADRASAPPRQPLTRPVLNTAASRRPLASVNSAALAAYRAMWADLTAASARSDPDAQALEHHARGNALALLRFGLTRQRNMHTVTRGRPRIHPEVVGVTSHKVTLRDCVDDRRWLEYKTSGGLMDKVPGSHSRADATVTQAKNIWKVSKLYLHGPGSC
jgi:hypothetical protein